MPVATPARPPREVVGREEVERFGSAVITARVVLGSGLAAVLALVLVLVRTPGDVLYVPVAHFLGEGLTTVLLARSLRRRGIGLRPQ